MSMASGAKSSIRNTNPSTEKVIKNSIYNSGAWLVTILVGVVVPPVFIRQLSVEGYGIYALLLGLTGYYGLLDLGLGRGVTKFVAEYQAKGDNAGIVDSINAALVIQIALGFVGSALLLLFANPVLRILNISPGFWVEARIGLYVSTIGFFFAMLASTFGSVLMGLQRYDLSSKASAGITLLFNISLVISLCLGARLWHAVLLKAISQIVLFVVYYVLLRKWIPQWRFSLGINKDCVVTLFKFSGFLFSSRVSQLFSNYVVSFIISGFLGPSAVAYYQVPKKLVNAFGGFLSGAFSVIFPFTSEIGVNGNSERLRRVFIEASKALAALSVPFYLALFIFAKPILTIWMGVEFAESGWLILRLLSLSALLGSLTTVPNTMTIGLGHSKLIGLFAGMTALCYIVLSPAFTRLWGIQGTAWAILGATLPGLILVGYESKNIFHLRIGVYLREVLGFHLIFFVVSLPIILFGDKLLALPLWGLVAGLSFAFFTYAVCIVLLNRQIINRVFHTVLGRGN